MEFRIERFALELRRDVVSRYKAVLRSLGLSTAALLLCEVIGCWIGWSAQADALRAWMSDPGEVARAATQSTAGVMAPLLYTLLSVMVCVGMCQAFSCLRQRQGRIAHILSPASRLEKFVSRFVQYAVAYPLLLVAALSVADVLRMALLWPLGNHLGSLLPAFFGLMGEAFSQVGDLRALSFVISASVWSFTFFWLGSVLFRKNAWLLTVGSYFVVLFALSVCLGVLATTPFVRGLVADLRYGVWQLVAADALCWLLAAGHVWLSWRVYCRVQVISPKYLNV